MANLTITKITDGYFDFTDDAGNIYGGNNITYWYDAVNVYFKVNNLTYTYTFEEVSYDDGTETIGFASTIEVITALKTAGFTGNFNQGGATPQNQTYEVKLSQFGKVSQNDGLLVIGEKYLIYAYSVGDDFTNVGASENFSGVEFVATETTPTLWINGSQLISNYEPLITEVENTLTTSTITYESIQIGFYRFLVNDPNDIIVTAYANTSFNSDLFPFEIVTCFVTEDNKVFVELKKILILGTELITEAVSLFESFNIKINIKKI